jgi:adenosylhomocysteine nucleosidase
MKLLLLYAFPREVRDILRLIGRRERIDGLPFSAFSVAHPSHALTAAETGLGAGNAARVLLHMVRVDRPDRVISLGYCGGLSPDAAVGDVIWASEVCLVEGQQVESLSLPHDRKLLEKLSMRTPLRAGTFLTTKEWTKKQELARHVTPGMTLPVCDMETFGLARLCHEQKLPFLALRAVSDGADTDLAFDPWSVCDGNGTYRTTRALKFFLTRPRLLIHAMDLRRNSKIASRNLAHAVNGLLRLL